jgi:predicted nucleic acid-binding protein
VSIVADSSPLIALHAIERLDLLRDIYQSIVVPEAVAREIRRFRLPSWIEVCPLPKDPPQLEGMIASLGRGEIAAIQLAIAHSAQRVVIDDWDARSEAMRRSLKVVGTCGFLLAAKNLGLIPSLARELDKLLSVTFRLSPRLYRELLVLAGER